MHAMKTKNDMPPAKVSDAKTRILLTAHDLFYQNGIRATGVDRLIKESGVTKVTFYRHYPSKNDLILAFLHYRHDKWMAWFSQALEQKNNQIERLTDVLSEWFSDSDYRGCAFINSVGEIGSELPEVSKISLKHKEDMTNLIAASLLKSGQPEILSEAISLAIDGAITRVQSGQPVKKVLETLQLILEKLLK
ncbi:MAG: TetR/AcrR family transcriptional regulator [Thiotrichales bacterium]|nr:TetR/AcrR family transcriptional regulator [Thiotrichales bacterium]